MLNATTYKASFASNPSLTVVVADSSGSTDSLAGNGGNIWLDSLWAGWSGDPSQRSTLFWNGRLQTAYAKHNNRVNVVYVDGHAAPSLPERTDLGTVLRCLQTRRGAAHLAFLPHFQRAIGRAHLHAGS